MSTKNDVEYKFCRDPHCAAINPQPVGNFHRSPTAKDGRQYSCKECANRRDRERNATFESMWRKLGRKASR